MLIFDSGIGGLSILKKIKKKLPNISYIYLLDNQAFPYGEKTESFIIERSIKIIDTIKKKYPITTIVIACNTVSTISLSILKKKFNMPIFGVIPEIELSKKITKNKIIGLIATPATINSTYIKKMINSKSYNNIIKTISTNQLARIAENKIRGCNTSKIQLQKILKSWINTLVQPDTIILGCTHFSFLKKDIRQTLHNKPIFFIDSIDSITLKIAEHFKQLDVNQNIKKNILLYSKDNKNLRMLLYFLKQYDFKKIKNIKLD